MKALAKTKKEPGIWMIDAPEPEYGHNDLLIKIKITAICGTDVHIYNWDAWSQKTVPVPMITGHEFVGTVIGIGDEVAAIFDPFGNAVHTALSFNTVGEDVLITGAGPIGIMAAAVVKHAGARYVIITDVNDYRLNLARQMGATRAGNIKNDNLEEIMGELHMLEGFDIGMEMSGNPSAQNQLFHCMNNGGRVAMLGIPPGETQVNWNDIIFKGLLLKGIYGREMFETWYKMAAMIRSGLDITRIITHRLPIDEFEKGFEIMASGQSGKVLLYWE